MEAQHTRCARDAILHALIEGGHQITADEIRFFRDPSKPTTALAQLCDRLEAVVTTEAAPSAGEAPRGTNAQILKERELTVSAIQGAMAFGAQGVGPAPTGHWLEPFWHLGNQHAEMLAVLQTIVRAADGRHFCGNLILDENSPIMGAARDAIAKATGAAQ